MTILLRKALIVFGIITRWKSSQIFCKKLTRLNSKVKKDVIGTTFEGRNIFGLKISDNLSSFGEKPIIFIDAGTHAREWASHHSALYLAHKLATDPSNELLNKVDWIVIPNVNPDGYEYTRSNERLWRKNRRVLNSTCIGIDLNRNYAYEWRYIPNSVSNLENTNLTSKLILHP